MKRRPAKPRAVPRPVKRPVRPARALPARPVDAGAAKAAVAERRKAIAARMSARGKPKRPARSEDRAGRRGLLAVLLLLLLLLLAWLCCCGGVVTPEPPVGSAVPVVEVPLPAVPLPEPLTGQVKGKGRPAFTPPPVDVRPWLSAFRMQVAARSPRLASCFVGTARPGSLRWTTLIEPGSGRVAEHQLEPMLGSDPLTTEQRDCVLAVLATPSYMLSVEDGAPSTPARVSTAIEF